MTQQQRLPQRFAFSNRNGSYFGVCFPFPDGRWRIDTQRGGFGSFDDDPWEILGGIIGHCTEFAWIDNDFGWASQD